MVSPSKYKLLLFGFEILSIQSLLNRVQFTLGKYESRDKLDARKKELAAHTANIRRKLEGLKESREDKVEAFKTEIAESYEHLKKAINELF